MKVDHQNPDPERGIFGCFHAADEYSKAEGALPEVDVAVSSLSASVEQLLAKATGTYYTSNYGPSGPFRHSARTTIEELERTSHRLTEFVKDIRENFLRESPPADRPLSFFVSYSHKDGAFTDRFVSDLRKLGHTVWRDDDDIKIGQSIRREIEKGLGRSRFAITLISKSSLASEWCQKEIDMALVEETAEKTRVLPVVIEDCEIPLVLRGKRYFVVKDYQRDFDKFISLIPK